MEHLIINLAKEAFDFYQSRGLPKETIFGIASKYLDYNQYELFRLVFLSEKELQKSSGRKSVVKKFNKPR